MIHVYTRISLIAALVAFGGCSAFTKFDFTQDKDAGASDGSPGDAAPDNGLRPDAPGEDGGDGGDGGICLPSQEVCNDDDDDCDGEIDDGFDKATNARHCGSCGHRCADEFAGAAGSNGEPICESSTCKLDCYPGYDDCTQDGTDDGCESLLNTATNCGTCGDPCTGDTPFCVANGEADRYGCTTTCVAPNTNCGGGVCTMLATDTTHCGSCGTDCGTSVQHAQPKCTSGSCDYVTCDDGFGDCDRNRANGCEADLAQGANCGACGNVCAIKDHADSVACTDGACVFDCEGGYFDCDLLPWNGCEVDLLTDTGNCGFCDNTCPAVTDGHGFPICAGGRCDFVCDNDWDACDGNKLDGCETQIGTPTRCGGCFDPCPAGYACNAGECALGCTEGRTNCYEECVDTNTDPRYCGSCTTVPCPAPPGAIPICNAPSCTWVCEDWAHDCDGDISNGCEAWLEPFYPDADRDGFGNKFAPAVDMFWCDAEASVPPAFVRNNIDCEDDPSLRGGDINPFHAEVCDRLDNDCDINTPDGSGEPDYYYQPCQGWMGACPYTSTWQCDAATWVCPVPTWDGCDGIDNDCDGSYDEDMPPDSLRTFYRNRDDDWAGATASGTVVSCGQPSGYSWTDGDCNDDDPNVFPGAPERCNRLDDNCDGYVDENQLSQSNSSLVVRELPFGSRLRALRAASQPLQNRAAIAWTVEGGHSVELAVVTGSTTITYQTLGGAAQAPAAVDVCWDGFGWTVVAVFTPTTCPGGCAAAAWARRVSANGQGLYGSGWTEVSELPPPPSTESVRDRSVACAGAAVPGGGNMVAVAWARGPSFTPDLNFVRVTGLEIPAGNSAPIRRWYVDPGQVGGFPGGGDGNAPRPDIVSRGTSWLVAWTNSNYQDVRAAAIPVQLSPPPTAPATTTAATGFPAEASVFVAHDTALLTTAAAMGADLSLQQSWVRYGSSTPPNATGPEMLGAGAASAHPASAADGAFGFLLDDDGYGSGRQLLRWTVAQAPGRYPDAISLWSVATADPAIADVVGITLATTKVRYRVAHTSANPIGGLPTVNLTDVTCPP